MNAIILAAGEGTRLKRYTADLPKGMLPFQGKTLIAHQLDRYRAAGIERVAVVRGYRGECIDYPQIETIDNPRWAHTNMVHSLMCARALFAGGAVVSYADIFFSGALLQAVLSSRADVAVAVDVDWRSYWQRRYGRIDIDTESLRIDADGCIRTLGLPGAAADDIDGRYVGLLKFSPAGLRAVERVCDEAAALAGDGPWQQSGQPFCRAYMTDLLQALIDRGHRVHAVAVHGGWLEFDTNDDYERQKDWEVAACTIVAGAR